MRKLFFSVLFLASVSGSAVAQSTKDQAKGSNLNPDAPVNVSEPALRPVQPAQYSSTSIPQEQKGQFYVKDDKPADAAGNIIVQPTTPPPAKPGQLKSGPAGSGATAPAGKAKPAGAKPAAKKANK